MSGGIPRLSLILEVIDVEGDDGKRVLLAVRARQLAQEELLQETAVVQAGEGVADRLLPQAVAHLEGCERKADLVGDGLGELEPGFPGSIPGLFAGSQVQEAERFSLCEQRNAQIGRP
jgi:hypothetical protein